MIILRPQLGQNATLAGISPLHWGQEMVVLLKTGASIFPFATIFAEAVNLKGVTSRFVPVLTSNLLLYPIHFWREEFDRGTA